MSTAEHPDDAALSSAPAPTPAPASASASPPGQSPPAQTEAEGGQADAPPTADANTGLFPASHWMQLTEQQDPEDDNDSALGDTAASSTDSISSSILEYRTIHGRTYHSNAAVSGNAQYWGTNDNQQNESMDINHQFLYLCTGERLHFAPLGDNIQRVLDIGTGTGLWAIDFADEHPQVEVIGTDISPIQPNFIPPNLRFEIEDCTANWTFSPGIFDYVHMRYLVGSIIDWTALFREAYDSLQPGGWLESVEGSPHMVSDDGTVPDESPIAQWGKFFEEGGRKMGRSFMVVQEGTQRKAMEEAGFVDIQEWDFKAPVGSWPRDKRLKEIGIYGQAALESDIEGYVLFIANVIAGWTREEILAYIALLRRAIRTGKHHAYFRLKAVWGRKPESA